MLDVLTASAAEPALVVTPADFNPMGEKSAPVATSPLLLGLYREVATRLLSEKFMAIYCITLILLEGIT